MNNLGKKGMSKMLIYFLLALVFFLVYMFIFPSELGDASNPFIKYAQSFWGEEDEDKDPADKDDIDSVYKVLMANQVSKADIPLTFKEYKDVFAKKAPKKIFTTDKFCVYEIEITKEKSKDSETEGEIESKKAFFLIDRIKNVDYNKEFVSDGIKIVTTTLDSASIISMPLEERAKLKKFENYYDTLSFNLGGGPLTAELFKRYGYDGEDKFNAFEYFDDCYLSNGASLSVLVKSCLVTDSKAPVYVVGANNYDEFVKITQEECLEQCYPGVCNFEKSTISTATEEEVQKAIEEIKEKGLTNDFSKETFRTIITGNNREFKYPINGIETDVKVGQYSSIGPGDPELTSEGREHLGMNNDYYMYMHKSEVLASAAAEVLLIIKKSEINRDLELDKESGFFNPTVYIMIKDKSCKSSAECIKPMQVEGQDVKLFTNYKYSDRVVSPYKELKDGFCEKGELDFDITSFCTGGTVECPEDSTTKDIQIALKNECIDCLWWKEEDCDAALDSAKWLVDFR